MIFFELENFSYQEMKDVKLLFRKLLLKQLKQILNSLLSTNDLLKTNLQIYKIVNFQMLRNFFKI